MNPLKCVFCEHAGDFLGFVVHKRASKMEMKKPFTI
jgi:hypothetical protein